MWFDIHTHLNMLEEGPEQACQKAQDNSVVRLITIATDPKDNPEVLALAKRLSPMVYCTQGIHPHDAKLFDEEFEQYLIDHLSEPEVVAVGEIGLDYYYDHSDRKVQQKVFRRQLEIAQNHNMPVEIHTRDAEPDTIKILKEFNGNIKGVIHCFSGSTYLAEEALKLGLDISISGIVTFKKAEELREIVKSLPLDRIHVETDSPFLAPIPHRGRKNTSAYVVHVAEKVAELKGVSLEALSLQTQKNALRVFNKIKMDKV